MYRIPRRTLEKFVWNLSILTDAPQDLLRLIDSTVQGNLVGVNIPILSILELVVKKGLEMEITNPRAFRGREFTANFSFSRKGKYRVLTKTGKNVVNKLLFDLANTELITPRNHDAEEKYLNKSGRLLIPEAIRFNTTPLVATWSDNSLVSSVAYTLALKNQMAERALCTWLNSTFTILYLWTLFSTVEEKYGHIRGWHIRTIPTPDLTNERVVANLENVFTKYQDITWDSLPVQYKNVIDGTDLTRLEYDFDVLNALARSYNQEVHVDDVAKQLLSIYSKLMEIVFGD